MNNGSNSFVVGPDDPILITGAGGFIGSKVVEGLLDRGFRNLVCFARPSGKTARIEALLHRRPQGAQVKIVKGNLLSRQDCEAASKDVALVYHLAAGIGEKSYPDAFMNSVVTTRNLLDACRQLRHLRRFTLVSSFTVYSNRNKGNGRLLDESCPLEDRPDLRGEAYCFGKLKQEEIIVEYGKNFGIPYTILRPGSVYGAEKPAITGRVGIDTFGVFLHMGGSNTIPFTYVDNCAEAIILAGLVKGVDGEIFNIVDDDLLSSRRFLRLYKTNVKRFRSIYVPHAVSHMLCSVWEKYSDWSQGQLPRAFNLRRWHNDWKKTRYSNQKLKSKLGWKQKVPTSEALRRYFQGSRESEQHA